MAHTVSHLKGAIVISEEQIAEYSPKELSTAYIGDAAQPDAEVFAATPAGSHAYLAVSRHVLIDTGPSPDEETFKRIKQAVSMRFWSC